MGKKRLDKSTESTAAKNGDKTDDGRRESLDEMPPRAKPVSLAPLSFEEAVKGLINVKPTSDR